MEQLLYKDIETVSTLIKNKEISPIDLTEVVLKQIDNNDNTFQAYITVLYEEARAQALKAEQEIVRGNIRSPLHGIPLSIKDIFTTKESSTTSGSIAYIQKPSLEDAVVVQKLKEAGAIIVGKANLHEFAMGSTTENPHYGTTRNPWNTNKIAGGSSGGSAVSVATGMAYGSIGTDTGGSIRLPAALCGIVGFKPTYDKVSRSGCTTLSWTLDHVGPLARTVKDCQTIFSLISEKYQQTSEVNFKNLRIGICTEYFFDDADKDIQNIMQQTIDLFKKMGAAIIEMKIKDIDDALEAHKVIMKAEAYTFHETMYNANPEKYGVDLQYRLESGRNTSTSEYIRAQLKRSEFQQYLLREMQQNNCDVLLYPTNITSPFDIGTSTPEETINNIFNLGRTPLGNLLGFPCLSIPCGLNKERLPVGFQLMGKPNEDNLLLKVGELYEKQGNWLQTLEYEMRMERVGY